MHDIFISYSSKDREWVARLANALEAQGYRVWWDPEILPGQHYQDVIQKALHGAKSVVAVWTADSVLSDYVRAECLWAFNKRNLISVLGKDAEIPTPFNAIQAADLRKWKGSADDPQFQRLLRGIHFAQTGETQVQPPPNVEPPPPKFRMGVVLVGAAVVAVAGGAVYWQQHGGSGAKDAPVAVVQPVMSAVKETPNTPQPDRLAYEPEMVDIPAGTFTMGCDGKRDDVEGGCSDDEKPAHKVTLNAFKMAKTETTVAQFRAFVEAKSYKTTAETQGSCWGDKTGKGDWGYVDGNHWKKTGFAQTENDPVTCVSWDDAQAYLQWLNAETGKAYRLPTEAEWEYAARGGKQGAYPWGQKGADGCGHANMADRKAKEKYPDWIVADCNDGYIYTAPVGSFAANGYGLHDMHGNVWEWCQDWYDGGYYASSPTSNPEGAASGTNRVLRGGSWSSDARYVRSADRDYYAPVYRNSRAGLRLVLP